MSSVKITNFYLIFYLYYLIIKVANFVFYTCFSLFSKIYQGLKPSLIIKQNCNSMLISAFPGRMITHFLKIIHAFFIRKYNLNPLFVNYHLHFYSLFIVFKSFSFKAIFEKHKFLTIPWRIKKGACTRQAPKFV